MLYKTTIIVWSNFEPQEALSDLLIQAEHGDGALVISIDTYEFNEDDTEVLETFGDSVDQVPEFLV